MSSRCAYDLKPLIRDDTDKCTPSIIYSLTGMPLFNTTTMCLGQIYMHSLTHTTIMTTYLFISTSQELTNTYIRTIVSNVLNVQSV